MKTIRTLLGISMILLLMSCSSSPSSSNNNNTGNTNPTPTNGAPSAAADVDMTTVDVGSQVTLDASASSDPDGDALSYSWSLNAPGGSSAQLSDDQAEAPTFTADISGDYTATVTVDDGNGESDQDNVTITAESNIIEISSDITEDQTWTADNLYRVTANIDIKSGAKVIIEPGVRVEFATDAGININADNSVLVSAGTQEDPITFTGIQQTVGYWRGIRINSNSLENEISHSTIEFAGSTPMGIYVEKAALTIDQAKVQLSDVTIRKSGG